MRLLLLAFSLLLASSAGNAAEYGSYDLQRLLTVADSPGGKQYGIDGAYLDRMLGDLHAHAGSYPPRFDTDAERQRAVQDVRRLSAILDVIIDAPDPGDAMLLRAGFVHSVGHHLDLPGAAAKAHTIFAGLLAANPANAHANYLYGTFLGGSGKAKEALPYLEKALALGVVDADYALGMTHLLLGDRKSALEYLDAYQQRKPADTSVGEFIAAIRSGRFELRKPAN